MSKRLSPPTYSRRALIAASASLFASPSLAAIPDASVQMLGASALFGWCALDLETGKSAATHPDLQLPMCSSFKWLLAAAVLSRVDSGQENLDRQIVFTSDDIVFNSPTVETALKASGGTKGRLSILELCEAAVTLSDSTAANLLLATMGGPAGLTAWLRANGDPITRLDRTELALNQVSPGDLRDTTTAKAMVANLKRFLYGPGLAAGPQSMLMGWLLAAKPGATRMPAGLRPGWRIGHKTGTWQVGAHHRPNERSACADAAVLLPPQGAPILIAAFTAGSERTQPEVDQWFAKLVSHVTEPGTLR